MENNFGCRICHCTVMVMLDNLTAMVNLRWMRELENKPFHDAMKRKYGDLDAENRDSELCLLWEEYLRYPNWHPFEVITINGKSQVGVTFYEKVKQMVLHHEPR